MPRDVKSRPLTYSRVLEEVQQGHSIRQELYHKLEEQLGGNKKVVAFFTSFTLPVLLQDQDADMLEEVLNNSDMDGKELVLLLNSPGGDALAAERIVNVCRSFSTDGFTAIVPKMAKSAATMICLGAKTVGMSKTSELGPIDPQILINDERGRPIRYQAAHEVLESYNGLMKQANQSKGRLEPFLQQLARFDARDIRSIISAQQLSESIAITLLKSGVLNGLPPKQIKSKIRPFLDPRHTKVHGRPIYYDIAEKCGLDIKLFENRDVVWQTVWQLYVRMNYVVTHNAAKVIESSDDFYVAPLPQVSFLDSGIKTETER